MTIKKILFGSVLAIGMVGTAKAQYTEDALLFSQGDNGGTARFKAMGGASTALGGDISSITGNPAGLGFYNQSDASATLRYQYNKNKVNYFGRKSDSKTDNFNIDNGGVVFHLPTVRYGGDLTKGWLNFNVGIAYNRTNLFDNKLDYSGINTDNSITHAYADRMIDPTQKDWADDFYKSFMFEEDKDKKFYFPLAEDKNSEQFNSVWSKGGKSETALSFGSNYSNKFYIGATFSLTDFRYEKSAVFTEYGMTKTAAGIAALNPNSDYLKPDKEEFNYVDVDYELFDRYGQVTQGSGFDFKLGMIYKPTPSLSLGFTAKTPTFLSIADESTAYTDINYFKPNVNTSFASFKSSEEIGSSSYDYNLQTPYKLSAGVTQYLGAGLLTAEVEFVDYASMRWRDSRNNSAIEKEMNNSIKETYQAAFNVRLGGEVLFDQTFSGRAGFNFNGNPYKNADYKTYGISAGVGAKLGGGVYLDLTGVYNANNYKESPYKITYEGDWNTVSPRADIKNSRTNVMLTIGSKF